MNSRLRNLMAIIFLITSQLNLWAQTELAALEGYFSEVRASKYVSMPMEIVGHENPLAVLEALTLYYRDSIAPIRSKAYALTQQIGTQAKDPNVRQQSVQQLVSAFGDADVGNVGIILEYLVVFKKEDFNDTAKEGIRKFLLSEPPHIHKIFRLTGFLDLVDQIEFIRLYTEPGTNKGNRWAATITLARMNDLPAIQDAMNRVKKLNVNDDIIESVFPDLLYTRQKPALDYMIEIMKSDAKNCTSTGENEAPIACGYRIMEQLAKAVKGYPLELDESGDIKTKDYKQALITVRAWFETHKEYEIDRDTF